MNNLITLAEENQLLCAIIFVCVLILYWPWTKLSSHLRVKRLAREAKERAQQRQEARIREEAAKRARGQYVASKRQQSRTTIGWLDKG